MAPEVVRERYTLSADLWSVGVMAYLLLTGRLPFPFWDTMYVKRQVRIDWLMDWLVDELVSCGQGRCCAGGAREPALPLRGTAYVKRPAGWRPCLCSLLQQRA